MSNDPHSMTLTSSYETSDCLKNKELLTPMTSHPVGQNSLPVGSQQEMEKKAGEPVSREKLKYLRYFRLVTHRKRHGKCTRIC